MVVLRKTFQSKLCRLSVIHQTRNVIAIIRIQNGRKAFTMRPRIDGKRHLLRTFVKSCSFDMSFDTNVLRFGQKVKTHALSPSQAAGFIGSHFGIYFFDDELMTGNRFIISHVFYAGLKIENFRRR
ncbi:hypothetical protein [Bdellovibrio sp. HCB-162]|uniref:beta-xylosidase family glycoside hydrolase n=1 Tax=Bdellovibrio sp. HCB-162 TaxID=3394234 RepID=UPI0039BC38B7